jgi:hypothetical protein
MSKNLLIINCVLLSILSLFQGYERERVKYIGLNTGYFYEEGKLPTAIRSKLFEGLNCSKRFSDIISEEEAVYTTVKSSNVYFGNRLQWSYAQLGLPPPTNLPVIWDRGSSFSRADEEKLFNIFMSRKFDYMIFINGDIGCLTVQQQSAICSNYLVYINDQLDIYIHK